MGLLFQLGLSFPLWYAAYYRYGGWPCAALFLAQLVVGMFVQIAKKAA